MKSQSSIASWIFGKRTRQRKRMKTMEFNIATWNIQSMLQAGKMEEIAVELKKYNIKITALQEVKWPHDGWIKKKNYILYSGLKTSRVQHGTGFLITGCATQCIIGFEPINERMCKLRIKGKFHNMTLISEYAPTEDENKRNVEDEQILYQVVGCV